ncbi:MAG: hypothetical protein QXG00_03600 [Candidatus Woesearchaeota archaeon]
MINKKIFGLILIVVLILNLFLAGFRIYDFLFFWIILSIVIIISFLLTRKKGLQ